MTTLPDGPALEPQALPFSLDANADKTALSMSYMLHADSARQKSECPALADAGVPPVEPETPVLAAPCADHSLQQPAQATSTGTNIDSDAISPVQPLPELDSLPDLDLPVPDQLPKLESALPVVYDVHAASAPDDSVSIASKMSLSDSDESEESQDSDSSFDASDDDKENSVSANTNCLIKVETASADPVSNSQSGRKRANKSGTAGRKNKCDDTADIDSDNEDIEASVLRTKNEAATLPTVEPVNITVPESAPLTHMGTVTGIVDRIVVVQAILPGEHTVFDTDTILLLANRTVLGKIFDTFGPVTKPFYSILFNSQADITQTNVAINNNVYYVQDLAKFVFTQKLRLIKGSDASNMHDEEVADDELEFSDDEKEAQFRRSRKRVARGDADTASTYDDVIEPGECSDQDSVVTGSENHHGSSASHGAASRRGGRGAASARRGSRGRGNAAHANIGNRPARGGGHMQRQGDVHQNQHHQTNQASPNPFLPLPPQLGFPQGGWNPASGQMPMPLQMPMQMHMNMPMHMGMQMPNAAQIIAASQHHHHHQQQQQFQQQQQQRHLQMPMPMQMHMPLHMGMPMPNAAHMVAASHHHHQQQQQFQQQLQMQQHVQHLIAQQQQRFQAQGTNNNNSGLLASLQQSASSSSSMNNQQ